VTQIRSFRNDDLPVLLELWIRHWSAFGPAPQVNLPSFELAIVSRTFFDPGLLWLARSGSGAQAWCHAITCPDEPATATIVALCAPPDAAPAAAQLLQAVEAQLSQRGVARLRVGVVRDDQFGYAGLEPIGHGIGVPSADRPSTMLLEQLGYLPSGGVARMIASVAGYRPPVSRDAMLLRRTSRVQTVPSSPRDVRHAAAMSHLDVEIERLVEGPAAAERARVRLWCSDAEAQVMAPSAAILDIAEAHQRGRLEVAEGYLIATLVQGLAKRRIETVETAVDSDRSELIEQLEKLQFECVERGTRWEKPLAG
jgi:hypothetical protein